MPALDMNIKELEKYMGVNQRPKDFDEFWDKSIAEMKALDPKLELIPAEFKSSVAKCYDMYFNGTENGRLHAKLLIPNNINGKAPACLYFHGYHGKSEQWSSYLGMAAEGFVVAALDCRGQAGDSVDGCVVTGNTLEGFITKGLLDGPEKLYYRNTFLDTAMLARLVMDMDDVDETRVAATGGSQGGGLTVACAALERRIALAAPVFPFLSDYKRTWDMDLDVDAYRDLRTFFRQRDPLHEKEEEFFTKLGYADIQFLAPRIKAEVLMSTGLLDNIVPPSTQFAMYNKITSKKKVDVYPDFGHEGLNGCDDRIHQFIMKLKKA